MKNLKKSLYSCDSGEYYKRGIFLFKRLYWSKTEYQVNQNEKSFRLHCLPNSKFKSDHTNYFEKLMSKGKKYIDYYIKQKFTGGMNSTQRNESIHNASISFDIN